MEQKPISTLTERWNSLRSSSIAWLTGSAARISRITSDAGFWLRVFLLGGAFAARISRITGDAGLWLWVYLIGVVFAAIGIYATVAWLF